MGHFFVRTILFILLGAQGSQCWAAANDFESAIYDVQKVQRIRGISGESEDSQRCYVANQDHIPPRVYYAFRDTYPQVPTFDEIKDQLNQLTAMSDLVLRITDRGNARRAARCTLNFLTAWAEADAIAGDFNNETGQGQSLPPNRHDSVKDQSEYEREYMTVALLFVYAKIKNYQGLNSDQDLAKKNAVEEWLSTLAYRVKSYSDRRKNYFDPTYGVFQGRNNHLYWEGLSSYLYGQIFNDPLYIASGVEMFDYALDEIQSDGTLPLEMARDRDNPAPGYSFVGDQAYQYTLYALIPLIMMAEVGKHNGQDLYNRDGKKLFKLIKMVFKTMRNQSHFLSLFDSQSDFGLQTVDPEALLTPRSHADWLLPWAEPFFESHKSNPSLYNEMTFLKKKLQFFRDSNRDLFLRRIGGNMTRVWGEEVVNIPSVKLTWNRPGSGYHYRLDVKYKKGSQIRTKFNCINKNHLKGKTSYRFRLQCFNGVKVSAQSQETKVRVCASKNNFATKICTSFKSLGGLSSQSFNF